jgi:hypothetical protein
MKQTKQTLEITLNQLKELASTSPAAKALILQNYGPIINDPANLSNITARDKSILIPHGGFGNRALLTLAGPYHTPYENKAMVVDSAFSAEIVEGFQGAQLLVFKQK